MKRTEMNDEVTGIARIAEKSRAAGTERKQQVVPALVGIFYLVTIAMS